MTETPSHAAVIGQIDEILAVLAEPLADDDRADGWTEKSRRAVQDGLSRLRRELDAGLFGAEADYASHHLVRVIDHWGVYRGRTLDRLASLQEALIEMRA